MSLPNVIHTQDGRTFVEITTDPVVMHAHNEEMILRAMLSQALFTEPDIEIRVFCPEHGIHAHTWHEPMTLAHVLNSHRLFGNPN